MIKNGMNASKLGSLDKYSQIILVYNVTVILPLNPSPALIARITHVHTYNTIAGQNSQLVGSVVGSTLKEHVSCLVGNK